MKKILLIIGFVIVLLLLTAALVFSFHKPAPVANYDAFTQCLTQKGVVMYGAAWCSHCANQKAMFGDSFKYIKYVECPDDVKLCTDKGVQGFPTWILPDGTKLEGEQDLQVLANKTGCSTQ